MQLSQRVSAGLIACTGVRKDCHRCRPHKPSSIGKVTPAQATPWHSDAWGKQMIPKVLIEGPSGQQGRFWGTGGHEPLPTDTGNNYPIPKKRSGTEIHMMWTDTPCRVTCWGGGSGSWRPSVIRRSVRGCHPLAGERRSLRRVPVTTTLECDDISRASGGDGFRA